MNGIRNVRCQYLFKGVLYVEIIKNVLVIIIVLIGVSLIGYGAYLAWRPLGFIVAGFLLTGFALTLDQPFKKGGETH